ncbi:hypothetical protein H6G52_00830 [Limnothrix sp. FACHB-881]|uniref:Uncharacterized protein n=1 Tax=Limnothrix redekei LRLZ20PSL1 TaxID=3112953 RepID=A0ABW7C7R6_9CYAN|nr:MULTISPECIES: hypothetical protein [unclassified Limnothrix]MBD2160584.1 hypothetical protein [Limnothrix sp. FACHB-1083]MBD2191286.1 hypothetical protein [Limnothrix sp. FACHB-1088]MBD2552250.1 hypothetical protein [Limnothrix sp. FACHB-708]MBD2590117.1 hypothetical protein [Limnothrix sp. FACHB-406]MBD2633891.1 hypothetical protein [Limnothrix sp. FACHB-881]
MSYHVSLLGPVSGQIQRCSDLDGWVPEPGDRWQSFRWDRRTLRQLSDPNLGRQQWLQWLGHAEVATAEAVKSLMVLEGWDRCQHP